MYKIDDITKLDLSDKKQYAIARETLDRYELTQSEKKGLLEGIKNRGGSDVDDTKYRYFVNDCGDLDYYIKDYSDEIIGSMCVNNPQGGVLCIDNIKNTYFGLIDCEFFNWIALKVNMNRRIPCAI